MKYAAFAAVLLAASLALGQPAVELSLGNGVVYVDMDPNTPANIFAFVLPGATDFAKGPDLPNPAEWTLVEFNGSCHLFSFTQTVYAGTILTVSGCPVTWNNATYVQSWGMGNDWLQERPTLYGSLACPTANVARAPQYAGTGVTLTGQQGALSTPGIVAVGDTFTVDLTVGPGDAFNAYSSTLIYDPAKLEVISIQDMGCLHGPSGHWILFRPCNRDGFFGWVHAAMGGLDPILGDCVVVRLTFLAQQAGSAYIDLDGTDCYPGGPEKEDMVFVQVGVQVPTVASTGCYVQITDSGRGGGGELEKPTPTWGIIKGMYR